MGCCMIYGHKCIRELDQKNRCTSCLEHIIMERGQERSLESIISGYGDEQYALIERRDRSIVVLV